MNYPELLNKLTNLDMPSPKVTDQHIGVVGQNCINLQKFSVRSEKVTEEGLRTLVMPIDLKGLPNKKYGKYILLSRFFEHFVKISEIVTNKIFFCVQRKF